MKKKLLLVATVITLSMLTISGCDWVSGTAAEPETTEEASEETVGLPNPASVHCEELGYTLEIRTDEVGSYGVCIFPDGSECEEWAFYRGECSPGTEAATEEPVEELGEGASSATYGGVSFSYDASLASEVIAETIPAVTEGPEWGIAPEHIEFSFGGYILPGTFHEPHIYVYPIADFLTISPVAENFITSLQALLAERPMAPESIPLLPIFNAAQLMRANIAYIDFQNGAGVRFIAQYDQAYMPINNWEVFYSFQGITSDGNYYVSVILPISNPILQADPMEIPGGDPTAFAENFDAYAADIAEQLQAQPPSSFVPDMTLLDMLIQSLEVNPTP